MVDARGPIRVDGRAYPGALRLSARGERSLDAVEPGPARALRRERGRERDTRGLAGRGAEGAGRGRAHATRCTSARSAPTSRSTWKSSVISQRFGGAPVPRPRSPPRAPRRASISRSTRRADPRRLPLVGGRLDRLGRGGLGRGGSLSAQRLVAGRGRARLLLELRDRAGRSRRGAARGGLLRRARSSDVRVTERSESGRVERIQLGSVLLSGRDLRELLGGRALRSAHVRGRGSRTAACASWAAAPATASACASGAPASSPSAARATAGSWHTTTPARTCAACARSDGRNDWSARR